MSDPTPLQLATTGELIDELFSRTSFCGAIVWLPGPFKGVPPGPFEVSWRANRLTAPGGVAWLLGEAIRVARGQYPGGPPC